MSKPAFTAALAALSLVACSELDQPSQSATSLSVSETPPESTPARGSPAGAWGRPRLDLFISTPEDAAGLENCIDATIAVDGDRTPERMKIIETVCIEEAAKAATPECTRWAQMAHRIAFKFNAFLASGSSNVGLYALQEAQKEDEPAAIACNASLRQQPDPNSPSTVG